MCDVAEILDEIFKFFGRDDTSSLAVLSSVSRSFMHASRRRSGVFRNLRIFSDLSLRTAKRLLASHLEHISPHVRRLTVEIAYSTLPREHSHDISQLVQRCSGIVKLDLQDVCLTLPRYGRMDSLRILRLCSVRLDHELGILGVISLCPGLTSLSLVKQRTNIATPAIVYPLALETLELDFLLGQEDDDASDILLSWLSVRSSHVSKLKRLNLYDVGEHQAGRIVRFLGNDIPDLQRLSVFVAQWDTRATALLENLTVFLKCDSWFKDGCERDVFNFVHLWRSQSDT